jgi:hypothetical protein
MFDISHVSGDKFVLKHHIYPTLSQYITTELGNCFPASREASPNRASVISAVNGRITSSLETSPASSYSASPLPPDPDDDEEEEEFIDTVEVSAVLSSVLFFSHEMLSFRHVQKSNFLAQCLLDMHYCVMMTCLLCVNLVLQFGSCEKFSCCTQILYSGHCSKLLKIFTFQISLYNNLQVSVLQSPSLGHFWKERLSEDKCT